MISISWAMCVCNEEVEFNTLLPLLLEHKKKNDEIVVLLDEPKASKEFIEQLENLHFEEKINLKKYKFENNFADWKNRLGSYCSKDYIFNLDPDEIPSEALFEHIHEVLETNNIDLYGLARENYVEGLTQEDIMKWGWRVDEHNRINYPDPQFRIYKNDNIKWEGKVHERLVGHKTNTILPIEHFYLIHTKNIDRQRKQNDFYDKL